MSRDFRVNALPARGFSKSLTLHVLVFATFYMVFHGAHANRPETHAVANAVKIFLPEARKAEVKPVATIRPGNHFDPVTPMPEQAAAPTVEIAADLNSMRLTFAADVSHQLPSVVDMHHGMLALLDKEDPAFARYLLTPPDWEVEQKLVDVSGSLRVLMNPPEEWLVFRDAAVKHSIPLDNFQACALFDMSYRNCLLRVIRERAALQPEHSGGRVTAAHLAFDATKPCGVDVMEVSFSNAPA